MIIKIERSGGLAAIPKLIEIDSKNLPPQVVAKVREIMEAKTIPRSMKIRPLGSADHYNFKISIHDGEKLKIIECNQYELQDELKSLVNYIDKNSKKAI